MIACWLIYPSGATIGREPLNRLPIIGYTIEHKGHSYRVLGAHMHRNKVIRTIREATIVVKPASADGSLPADRFDPFLELPIREARETFEREYLARQIARHGGNISRTAEFVGMERSAFHRKIKDLGLASEKRGAA